MFKPGEIAMFIFDGGPIRYEHVPGYFSSMSGTECVVNSLPFTDDDGAVRQKVTFIDGLPANVRPACLHKIDPLKESKEQYKGQFKPCHKYFDWRKLTKRQEKV
jgi:hypothetical protein